MSNSEQPRSEATANEPNRICIFCHTGTDGSMGAFWLAEDRTQKFVNMGSGSGTNIVCMLAENAIDFLRLLAIGYDEISMGEDFSFPPNSGKSFYGDDDFSVKPNLEFQNWARNTFNVEIVEHKPVMMGLGESLDDEFFKWVGRYL